MIKRYSAGNRQSPDEKLHSYWAVRTVLVTYGVAASSYLFMQSVPEGVSPVHVGMFSPHSLVLTGLVLQVLMIGVRALVRRHAPDPGIAAQGMFILELIGNGVTVLLFALGTFGSILHLSDI